MKNTEKQIRSNYMEFMETSIKKVKMESLLIQCVVRTADWLTGKSVFAKSESFDFEKFVLQELNQHFINKLKPEAICIRDKNLSFYKQEDAEGMEDPKGEYFVSYAVAVSINGQYIDEEDLYEIFPNFQY